MDFLTVLSITVVIGLVHAVKETFNAPPSRPRLVQEALEKNEPIYYFGLGSNMSRKKLENRDLDGAKIEILNMEAAVVPNYRLAFNLRGFPPLEPGMGSLEPIESDSKALLAYEPGECHGALVKLTPENYEKVMRSEGVGLGRSDQGYEEIVVDAYPYHSRNKPVKAIALRARPHVRLNFDPCPSVRYMNILKEGAKELGLMPCYLEFLERHPVQKLSTWQKKQGLYNFICMFAISRAFGGWRGLTAVQSKALFLFYVGPSAPAAVKLASNLMTAFVLLPGSVMGYIVYHSLNALGKTPLFMTRMFSLFQDTESKP